MIYVGKWELFNYMNKWERRKLNSVIGATYDNETHIKLTSSGDGDDHSN
jgi:hypothetical protein